MSRSRWSFEPDNRIDQLILAFSLVCLLVVLAVVAFDKLF
jgi:hypothetical protein